MKTGLIWIVVLAWLVGRGNAGADIFWREDFDDPAFKGWHAVQKGTHGDNLHIVDSGPLANGKHALDIHVYPDDCTWPGDKKVFNNRDELGMGGSIPKTHSGLGQTAFYRIAYYFPEDLNPNEHGHNTIAQFHAVDSNAAPPVDLDINAKEKPVQLVFSARGGPDTNFTIQRFPLGEIPHNDWAEVILGIHWGTTDGWVEVWRRDGLKGDWKNVVPHTVTPTLFDNKAAQGAFLKMGYYRGPDGKVGKSTGPWPKVSHLIIGYIMGGDTLDDVRNAEPK